MMKIQRGAEVLRAGGVIAYPTEAVWGFGCSPDNEAAVHRVLSIKQRPVSKGVIVVASDIEQLQPYLAGLSDESMRQLKSTWPGPITWLVPDNGRAPAWVKGKHQSLAVRVSAHPVVAALCRAYGGPVISTSANVQGRPPARTSWAVRHHFRDQLDCIIPGRVGDSQRPTEIRDLVTGQIHRAG